MKDLKNLFFILKTIKKEKKNKESEWYRFRLKNNWIGIIYCVINLTSDQASEEKEVRYVNVVMLMKDINEYMEKLGFLEIIHPDITEIDRSNYLITYSPIFRKLTVRYIIRSFLIILFIILLCVYFI